MENGIFDRVALLCANLGGFFLTEKKSWLPRRDDLEVLLRKNMEFVFEKERVIMRRDDLVALLCLCFIR